jgi:hypothetical protein
LDWSSLSEKETPSEQKNTQKTIKIRVKFTFRKKANFREESQVIELLHENDSFCVQGTNKK